MIHLLDVNVLVALAWPNHVHHPTVRRWFRQHRRNGWATCPVTESGFVRVSSNAGAVPDARMPREAQELLCAVVADPHHHFWLDDTSLATTEYLAVEHLLSHRHVTDAHLLALTLRHARRPRSRYGEAFAAARV